MPVPARTHVGVGVYEFSVANFCVTWVHASDRVQNVMGVMSHQQARHALFLKKQNYLTNTKVLEKEKLAALQAKVMDEQK